MKIAIPVVVAIIIHNIPAGISISSPIYHATGSRMKAIKYSFLSGLAEPAGALAGWLILVPFMSDLVFGFLSVDESPLRTACVLGTVSNGITNRDDF